MQLQNFHDSDSTPSSFVEGLEESIPTISLMAGQLCCFGTPGGGDWVCIQCSAQHATPK